MSEHHFMSEESTIHKNKDKTGDFDIIIKNQRIKCHRVNLQMSPYLYGLLEAHHLDSPGAKEYRLTEEREDVFKIILAYLYDCSIDFKELNDEQKILILERAHLYVLPGLVELAKIHAEYGLSYENVLKAICFAGVNGFEHFEEICRNFIKTNIKELMSVNEFIRKLNRDQLIYIFNDLGDGLYLNELEVHQWIENWMIIHSIQSEEEQREIWSECIRLELLTEEDFKRLFLETGIYIIEDYTQAVQLNTQQRLRKQREPAIYFSRSQNVTVTGGVNAQKLLEHNSDEFFSKQSEFPHSKNLEENPIIIDLGQTRLINFILLVLFDNIRNERRGNHSFSYYVETSIERENNYFRVIDHSKFICRSKQKIYFYPREVRYIKIVGISSYLDINLDANNDHLFLCSFHCQLTDEPFDISRGIWAPDRRITDYNEKCLLAYGQNKPEVVIPWMLSPDCVESNYSFHKRHKKKYLLVQLTQPVFVNRIDMRLIGNDYNFTIERLDFNSNRNVFQMIMNEENYSNDYIEHILIHFLKIHGSSILNDEFKCGDLCCP